ncbi:MAG: hypothetical protein ACW97X_06240 [Candidatus Hodarchaeales archaeon]|jgi:hypothetical protein
MSVDEDILRPKPNKINPDNTPYPAKFINLVDGSKMVVRQINREETRQVIPLFYDIVRLSDYQYFDIVGARILSELLAYVNYRVHDEYVILGQDGNTGEVLGLVNSRLTVDPKVGMSLHTMTFKRGLRVGAHLFVAKMENHFLLGNELVYIVAESPIGFRRWMEELRLEPRPEIEHELGGVPSYALTKENWVNYVKPERLFGERPVPEDLLENCKSIKLPHDVTWQITGKSKTEFLKGL